jgi:hypothetical protein
LLATCLPPNDRQSNANLHIFTFPSVVVYTQIFNTMARISTLRLKPTVSTNICSPMHSVNVLYRTCIHNFHSLGNQLIHFGQFFLILSCTHIFFIIFCMFSCLPFCILNKSSHLIHMVFPSCFCFSVDNLSPDFF